MNKKKMFYTSLTALALASFSQQTFAEEVATEPTDSAVVTATPAGEATEPVTVTETPVEETATENTLTEATSVNTEVPAEFNAQAIQAQLAAGDTSYVVGTWENETTGNIISISSDSKAASALYPKGLSIDFSAPYTGIGYSGSPTYSSELKNDNTLSLFQGLSSPLAGSYKKASDKETAFEVVDWSWTGLESFEDSSLADKEYADAVLAGDSPAPALYVQFHGTYNNLPYHLVYQHIESLGGYASDLMPEIFASVNLPENLPPTGTAVYGRLGFAYYLPDGYIPSLTGRRELTDSKGGAVTVDVAVSEQVASLEVTDHIEPTQANPEPIARLAGQDFDLFDIELKDANGHPVTQLATKAIVKLPVDEGKTVDMVIYLPLEGNAQILDILKQENGYVFFETDHFSHYGVVYASTPTTDLTPSTPAPTLTASISAPLGNGGAGAAATTNPAYSRVARHQAEPATKASKNLPNTGDRASLIGYLGLGLSALGLTGLKRRQA